MIRPSRFFREHWWRLLIFAVVLDVAGVAAVWWADRPDKNDEAKK